VTCAYRGHIWNVADVGAQPFGCSFGYTTAADGFAGWVAHWVAGKTGTTSQTYCQANCHKLRFRRLRSSVRPSR
jgi:hypothetical protein